MRCRMWTLKRRKSSFKRSRTQCCIAPYTYIQYHLIQGFGLYAYTSNPWKQFWIKLIGYMTVPDMLYECQHVSDQARKCTCMKRWWRVRGTLQTLLGHNTISSHTSWSCYGDKLTYFLELLWRQAHIFYFLKLQWRQAYIYFLELVWRTSLHIFPGIAMETSLHIFPGVAMETSLHIFPGVAMETSLHIFPFSCRVRSSIAGCGSFWCGAASSGDPGRSSSSLCHLGKSEVMWLSCAHLSHKHCSNVTVTILNLNPNFQNSILSKFEHKLTPYCWYITAKHNSCSTYMFYIIFGLDASVTMGDPRENWAPLWKWGTLCEN